MTDLLTAIGLVIALEGAFVRSFSRIHEEIYG
jgi:hypothetical protein